MTQTIFIKSKNKALKFLLFFKGIFNSYNFYYAPKFIWIYQHGKDFNFLGLDYFRYFKLKFTIYKPDQTWIPAIVFEFIIFGFGVFFITHRKK